MHCQTNYGGSQSLLEERHAEMAAGSIFMAPMAADVTKTRKVNGKDELKKTYFFNIFTATVREDIIERQVPKTEKTSGMNVDSSSR